MCNGALCARGSDCVVRCFCVLCLCCVCLCVCVCVCVCVFAQSLGFLSFRGTVNWRRSDRRSALPPLPFFFSF